MSSNRAWIAALPSTIFSIAALVSVATAPAIFASSFALVTSAFSSSSRTVSFASNSWNSLSIVFCPLSAESGHEFLQRRFRVG